MKGALKYLLIAAIGYYFYDQWKKSQYTKPHDIPTGGGGIKQSDEVSQLESIQGVKKLPHTY